MSIFICKSKRQKRKRIKLLEIHTEKTERSGEHLSNECSLRFLITTLVLLSKLLDCMSTRSFHCYTSPSRMYAFR